MFTGMDSWVMAICVLVYSALLFTMANLTLQRYLMEQRSPALYGFIGGMSFAASDLMIAVDKWKVRKRIDTFTGQNLCLD